MNDETKVIYDNVMQFIDICEHGYVLDFEELLDESFSPGRYII